jgi:superfamily II DNA or RNA helicase
MSDLFSVQLSLRLPERVALLGRIGGNLIYRLQHPSIERTVNLTKLQNARGRAYWKASTDTGDTLAIVDFDTASLLGTQAFLKVENISSPEAIAAVLERGDAKWILPKPTKPTGTDVERKAVAASWKDKFQLVTEEYDGHTRVRNGLRPPQCGAIHATKAHWSVSNQAATLVLPTGTGKTDTMAALLVSEQVETLLVIVPTDPLRRQIGKKFVDLDVLKATGLVPVDLLHPAVAFLTKGLKTVSDVEALVAECNVIVATMSVLSAMSEDLRAHLAKTVTHLFIDEAHHIGAKTWKEFKLLFTGKKILQFTATPYRNDGRRVDGKFIYVYPLRRAQADGLFTVINYIPIHGQGEADADLRIIKAVGEQLGKDAAAGFKHLAMARTSGVERAVALHKLYSSTFPQYRPQLIHSKMPYSERASALLELRAGRSKIIVCVDMLGEGFDLPDLKVAGLHDKHKSEAVTLQFVGRFTRSRTDLGSATVIANIQVGDVSGNLNALFAEDSDWNHILAVIGHTHTERERRREELFDGFPEEAESFPLETLEPRFSTVVYRTDCTEWSPASAELSTGPWSTIVEPPLINAESRLVIFVKRDEERLRWTSVKAVRNITYNMVMAHWDPELGLLYIHGSDLADLHTELAKALAGDTVQRITGEQVFRVLHGFRRLMLTNLGLSETQRKPVRYSQFMGSDIADQLDTLPGNRSRTKTNLFGLGYVDVDEVDENDVAVGRWAAKETIGCSRKGKFWSYQTSNSFSEWIAWCHDLGHKLLNDSITPETILRNVVKPKRLTALPTDKVPIGIAWPEEFLESPEDRIELVFETKSAAFFNCEIELDEFAVSDAIRFHVAIGVSTVKFEMRLSDAGASFTQVSGTDVLVRRGRSRKERRLIDVFQEDPPHIYFADGDVLIASDILILPRDGTFKAYDPARIEIVDWSGVDITAESQGVDKRSDTVQRRIIERLLSSEVPYDIIFDDDGTGEVADVVGIRRSGRTLMIDLFHCKYSAGKSPGARVEDLYEVCGQAQKSVRWAERFSELLNHLRRREEDRLAAGKSSRFEHGSMNLLVGLINQSREMHAQFSVTIVQPGYSRAKAAAAHLELFAATESYLMETWRMPMKILASA